MNNTVRIDKWLWAVRLFKTRSLAADACKKGRIMVNNVPTSKPSKEIKVGDTIQVRKNPITYSFKVLQLSENRMGAKLVPDFMENITPKDQLDIFEINKAAAFGLRDKGTGRTTKRDRRDIEDFAAQMSEDDFEWDFDEEE